MDLGLERNFLPEVAFLLYFVDDLRTSSFLFLGVVHYISRSH